MALTGRRRRPNLTTLAIRLKGIVTIPEAIREELDLHEGDHLVATVEDGRLVLIPASIIPDDQAWFWTPEWQAKEAEADQEIADGGGPVMSADEFIAELAQRAGLSADDMTLRGPAFHQLASFLRVCYSSASHPPATFPRQH